MSDVIRFPTLFTTQTAQDESAQVITLLLGFAGPLAQGGGVAVSTAPWLLDGVASPFTDIVLEVTSGFGATTVGNGTPAQEIGLFGELDLAGGINQRYLIGVLGISLGNAMPQIPLIGVLTGFAQVIHNVAIYRRLTIGGIAGAIPLGTTITVRARPIRRRNYQG